jgi:hypothetical protein
VTKGRNISIIQLNLIIQIVVLKPIYDIINKSNIFNVFIRKRNRRYTQLSKKFSTKFSVIFNNIHIHIL